MLFSAGSTDRSLSPVISQMSAPALSSAALPFRAILGLSAALLRVERLAIMGFMFLLAFLVLLNVVTRYAGAAIYWVDESAVYSVVWLTFIGASAMTRLRLDFAVSLLTDHLSERAKVIAKVIASIGVVVFAVLLAWMCWLWLDPAGIAAAGFDAKAYAGKSFNFIYTERTQTLNWPTWALYLIVPLFSLTMFVHGLANVMEDLGLVPRAQLQGFSFGQTDGIN